MRLEHSTPVHYVVYTLADNKNVDEMLTWSKQITLDRWDFKSWSVKNKNKKYPLALIGAQDAEDLRLQTP